MESNFVRADNSNLPKIDAFMVALFFKNNADYYDAELKNLKTAAYHVRVDTRRRMDPDEIEFLGEKSMIEIVPTFNSAPAYLIGGDVGPFRASIPTRVPLWVAVNLKQQQQCKIIPPEWMDVEKLLNIKDEEKGSQSFTKMPSEHYMIEAKLILGCAPDDIPRADEIRTIIKDIWDIRMSKLRSSMDAMIRKSSMYAAVDNLTLMEINSIRPILPDALDQIYRMKSTKNRPRSQGTSTLSHSRTTTSFTS